MFKLQVDGTCLRSTITFADSGDQCGIGRVREPVSRSKRGVQGKVADVLSERSRHAESLNEIDALRVLLASGRTDLCQEQPFVLEYHDAGSKHRYTPDLLAVWGSHAEAIEVKCDSEADLLENQERFSLIQQLLAEHGCRYRVWKSSEIRLEPRFSNAALVLRYRRVAVSQMVRERIRLAFSTQSQFCLRSLDTALVQCAIRLVLEGTLHIDWWNPLTLESAVSLVPLGPQIWPLPPRPNQESVGSSP